MNIIVAPLVLQLTTFCISLVESSPITNEANERETERYEVLEGTTASKSLKNLIKWMNNNMEDKMDQMGKKINSVNRYSETLKQELETLFLKEKYVEQKLDTMENGVRRKLNAMESSVNNKLELVQLKSQKPLTDIEHRFDSIESNLAGKLTKKFFLLFNIALAPFLKFIWDILKLTTLTAAVTL